MIEKNIENFIGCDSSYEDSSIVLFGAPLIPQQVTGLGALRTVGDKARKLWA